MSEFGVIRATRSLDGVGSSKTLVLGNVDEPHGREPRPVSSDTTIITEAVPTRRD